VRLFSGGPAAVRRRALAAGGCLADLRQGTLLDLIGSPFDQIARTAEMPRISSRHRQGRYGLAEIGLFVWRLKPYAITHAPAYCVEPERSHFTFSVLGAGTQLVTSPVPLPVMGQAGTSAYHPSAQLAGPGNVPGFITSSLSRLVLVLVGQSGIWQIFLPLCQTGCCHAVAEEVPGYVGRGG
jgi:hypothetical protein